MCTIVFLFLFLNRNYNIESICYSLLFMCVHEKKYLGVNYPSCSERKGRTILSKSTCIKIHSYYIINLALVLIIITRHLKKIV